jgi:hypothetical protein
MEGYAGSFDNRPMKWAGRKDGRMAKRLQTNGQP